MDLTLSARLQSALAGEYEIIRELGGGGMSLVFVAREIRLDREVVVKLLPPDVVAGIKAERFEREIRFAARLQHPHIVPLLSTGLRDGLLYYTMPYVSGPSLAARLKDSDPINFVEAISILRDVADALSYAHSEGVIHRDVKPQNILLHTHHAVVLDFGVAKAISEATGDSTLTSTGIALGTPTYMAPEQALADPATDERADIYSLGVVAYEVLTRRPPFSAGSPQQMMAAHVTSVPKPMGEVDVAIPPRVTEIVMRCLEKNPENRWQTAEELCEALNDVGARFTPSNRRITPHVSNLAESQTVPIGAHGTTHGIRRFLTRHWMFASAALVLVLALGAISYRGRHATPPFDEQLLVVMPFTNASGKEYEFFADGMTDEVVTSLVKVDGLHVGSAALTFALKDDEATPRNIGKRVGAKYVLQGTVRRAGKRLRITAHVVNVSKNAYAWSNSYDGTLDDVFNLQTQISGDIAQALTARLVVRGGQKLQNQVPTKLAAYDYYLKGNSAAREYSEDGLVKAIQLYDSALAVDSGYSRAYSAIAKAYYLLADDFWPPRKAYPLVRENALHALRLDPTSADAYASMASYEVSYGWDWERARENAQRAVALSPTSAFAHMILAWYYVIVGNEVEALNQAHESSNLDPYSYAIGANIIAILRASGRHDMAIAEARRMMRLNVGNPIVLRALITWEMMLAGRIEEARAQLDSAMAMDSTCCKRTRALYYAHTGQKKQAIEMLNQFVALKQANGLYYRADWIAEVMAAMGDREETFTSLNKALEDRSMGLPLLTHNAELARFENDPRYLSIKTRLNVP